MRAPGHAEQAVLDALEVLTDDVQPTLGQQGVDVGNAPGERVLAGQHRQPGAPLAHRLDRGLERVAGQRRPPGVSLPAG